MLFHKSEHKYTLRSVCRTRAVNGSAEGPFNRFNCCFASCVRLRRQNDQKPFMRLNKYFCEPRKYNNKQRKMKENKNGTLHVAKHFHFLPTMDGIVLVRFRRD